MNTSASGATEVPNRGPELISILWSLTGLAFLTAALRIFARTRNRMFGWDDIFMIFATVSVGATEYWCAPF
jgi:hypothetical protein